MVGKGGRERQMSHFIFSYFYFFIPFTFFPKKDSSLHKFLHVEIIFVVFIKFNWLYGIWLSSYKNIYITWRTHGGCNLYLLIESRNSSILMRYDYNITIYFFGNHCISWIRFGEWKYMFRHEMMEMKNNSCNSLLVSCRTVDKCQQQSYTNVTAFGRTTQYT